MNNEFFEPASGGDPSIQHIVWCFGYPSVWLTLFLWGLLFIAAFKISKRLKHANKAPSLILFIILAGMALAGYFWLATSAFNSYKEGLSNELHGFRYAKNSLKLLSIMSGCWIVVDWIKTRR